VEKFKQSEETTRKKTLLPALVYLAYTSAKPESGQVTPPESVSGLFETYDPNNIACWIVAQHSPEAVRSALNRIEQEKITLTGGYGTSRLSITIPAPNHPFM